MAGIRDFRVSVALQGHCSSCRRWAKGGGLAVGRGWGASSPGLLPSGGGVCAEGSDPCLGLLWPLGGSERFSTDLRPTGTWTTGLGGYSEQRVYGLCVGICWGLLACALCSAADHPPPTASGS